MSYFLVKARLHSALQAKALATCHQALHGVALNCRVQMLTIHNTMRSTEVPAKHTAHTGEPAATAHDGSNVMRVEQK